MTPTLRLSLTLSTCVLLQAARPPGAAADDEAKKLHQLFDAEWEHTMETSPTWASQLGDRRWNDRWPDVSLSAVEREHVRDQTVLAQLAAIRRDALPPADQLNYDMFRLNYERGIEGFHFGRHLIPLDQRSGIQTEDELGDALRFESVKDYENWIARLRAFGGYMDQTIVLMREGIRRGLVQPKVTMQRVPAQIEKQLVATAELSPFFKPLRKFSAGISAADRERLSGAAKSAVAESVLPAFQRFQKFFTTEYLPACLDGIGAWRWPEGETMYGFLARSFTTTELTPKQIHDIGLGEVARIRGEMEKVKTASGFTGTLPEFFHFLRTDPKFYCADEKQLFLEYAATAKRIDPLLVKVFRTLPRGPYGVEAIPAKIAPDTTAAYYRPLAADGSRAGTYFVNTYQPESRPRWEMMALSLHESVPGHHLQFALAQEQGELPRFRQHAEYTGYVEGWALYAESLGDELGLYDDAYSKFGQLTYEMWRAVRLVVDTGIHAFHWDRDKAIAFFRENAPKADQDIVNEVDRYISWPGQALAYKIGELKIKELRARATRELGTAFDVKEFHDIVLLGGAMPLSLLEQRVNEWLQSKKPRDTAQRRPRLQIINGSSEPIDIFWLKSETERLRNGSVAPGENTIITTTIGHRFAIVGRESKTEATVVSEVPVQGFRFDPNGKDGVPPFYTQRVEAHGFPIVASAKVNPYALKEAAYLIDLMLANRPDVREATIKSGSRMCLMAHDEYSSDLPEFARFASEPHRDFPQLSGRDYWDARARGTGGSQTDPFCTSAEENILGFPGDPYAAECILIHEFAHCIHLRGMTNVDPTFDARLKAAYDAAMKAGLWKGKYASTNYHEYFAEGVQTWFDNNRFNDHEHNHVHLRSQLIEYDAGLATMCREVFGDTEIKYTKPATRLTGHMAGYDPTTAPTFAWPERLKKAKVAINAKVKARDEAANAPHPNVLFIAVDDMRCDLGCYGVQHVQSPNLDKLAASGVLFTRAYCQQAVCNPSRASLMTGLRPDTTKVWDLDTDFRATLPDAVTIPQHFRQHGYRAEAFGKIFHNTFPDDVSWDVPTHMAKGVIAHSEENVRRLAGLKQQMKSDGKPAKAIERMRGPATEVQEQPDEMNFDGRQTTDALAKLRELAPGKPPFFLAVGYIRPHLPFITPKKYWDLYDRAKIPLATNPLLPHGAPAVAFGDRSLGGFYELRGYMDFADAPSPFERPLTEAQQRELKHGYYASVSFIDAQVGRLLAGLDDLGLAQNTVVVLWSDHGWKLGEHNGWCKQTNYEIDTRAPLMIRAPGAKANGQQCDSLVEFVDIYPTLCELAGLPTPENLVGKSLAPLLADASAKVKDAAFSQFPRKQDGRDYMGYAMRTERYRYVEWVEKESGKTAARELYDHNNDPDENENIADVAANAEVVRELSERLWKGFTKPASALTGLPRQTAPALAKTPVDFNHPPREYETRRVRDWTVLVEKQLATEAPDLAQRALERLDKKLGEAMAVLPASAHGRLKKLTLFLMDGTASKHGGRDNGLEYFQRSAPEHHASLDPRMAGSIVIYSAANYVKLTEFWALKALIHELAHAQHLEQWPEERSDIYDAWEHAKQSGLYRNVKNDAGSTVAQAYALQNHLEYFAEISCAYFVGCNYQPFNRAELKAYDPAGCALVEKLWDVREQVRLQKSSNVSGASHGLLADSPGECNSCGRGLQPTDLQRQALVA